MTLSAAGVLTVWNIKEIELLTSWSPPQAHYFTECVWSPCGKHICASDDDGEVFLFSFSMKGRRIHLQTARRRIPSGLRFEVQSDLAFAAKCERAEMQLARRIQEVDQTDVAADRALSPVVIVPPPEHIPVVVTPAQNPLSILPRHDYAMIQAGGEESIPERIGFKNAQEPCPWKCRSRT
jgi:hypothetical protein